MEIEETATVQHLVQLVVSAGVARWPSLSVDHAALARNLSETASPLITSPTLAAERYLAFACAERLPHAIEIFQKLYAPAIDGGARSVDASTAFVDEVRQRVLELLFIGGPSSSPRIVQYKGQGPLGAWLRTMSKRLALRLAGVEHAERLVSEEALVNELADSCDQELALLRAHYSEVFRSALVAALREIPARERVLLQLSLVGGVSTVRIGKMYHLNQSTISRQLQRAAAKTFDIVRQKLRAELGVASEEFESLLMIVRSHIEMTLSCFDEGSSLEISSVLPPSS